MSTAPNQPPAIGELLAQRRAERKLSLQELATMSGVSKGMISQIENGQVNPTLAIVWKLSSGLGVRLQDLLEGEGANGDDSGFTFLTEENCPTLNSAKNGYRIQILSSVDMAEHVELYLVHMAATGNMDSTPHAKGTVETVTVIRGDIEVVVGNSEVRTLHALDSARYRADVRHIIRAKGKKETLFYLAVKFPISDGAK
jgi:transcriptional regulator with XRE-family HTH domain